MILNKHASLQTKLATCALPMQPTKFFQHTSSKVMYHLTSSTSSYRDLNNKLHC